MGGFAELAEKHGGVHEEMEVVTPHGSVEVPVSGIGQVLVVGEDRAFALDHRLRPVAAENVDVRRHVLQVAGVGQQPAQQVGRFEPALRHGRHFQHMDVQVADARMDGAAALDPLHPGVHLRQHLAGVATRVGLSGLKVPELARRAVHRRVEIEGGDVGVVLMRPVRVAHRVGKLPVPGVQHPGVALVAVPVSLRQRPDEGLLGRRPIAGERDRGRHRVMADRQGFGDFGFRVSDPGPVVVGAVRVGDPPPGHGAGGVRFGRAPEAGNRFLMVEAVGPVQSAVEPALGGIRTRGDFAGPASKIEFVAHVGLLVSDRLQVPGRAPRRRLPVALVRSAAGLTRLLVVGLRGHRTTASRGLRVASGIGGLRPFHGTLKHRARGLCKPLDQERFPERGEPGPRMGCREGLA